MGRRTRAATDYSDTWSGGFIRIDQDGSKVFVIRRMINGKRYKVSTRCHDEASAVEQLRRFEADPEGYFVAANPYYAPLYLDADLTTKFLKWSKEAKKNSEVWLRQQQRHLAWWAEKLEGLDLRAGKGAKRVSLKEHLLPLLDGVSNREQRIRVLKTLYSWLRTVRHECDPAQDPTLDVLSAAQVQPEQWRVPKVVPQAHYEAVRERLAAAWQDRLDVLAATGWHCSELMRFAKSGRIERYHGPQSGIAGVLLCPQTKAGSPLRTAVSDRGLAAAEGVLEAGAFRYESFNDAVGVACDVAKVVINGKRSKVPRFSPGQFRHSVATWAMENGADPAAIASFLNHKSSATTKKFYATLATPAKVPTII